MPTTTSDGYIQKVTFSIFKMVQEPDVPMRIVPVDDLYPTLEAAQKEELLSHVAESQAVLPPQARHKRNTHCNINWR